MKLILQKYISQSGYSSRRKAEELIRQGKVTVNGKIAELGAQVTENDVVRIGKKLISLNASHTYIMLNKPVGFTCTTRKFEGEKNVFDLLTSSPFRSEGKGEVDIFDLVSPSPLRGEGKGEVNIRKYNKKLLIAGRLDKNSRGLLILTDDGDLVAKLTHPRYGHSKHYVAQINTDKIKQIDTNTQIIKTLTLKLKSGVDIGEGDGVVRAKDAKYLGKNKFSIVLAEGKKRQIRRMFHALGFEVSDLIRTRIASLELGDLPEGKWRRMTDKESEKLLNG